MRINPESLARASSRHPWRVVISWVVLIAAAGMTAGALLGGVLNNDIEFTNQPESVRAQNVSTNGSPSSRPVRVPSS